MIQRREGRMADPLYFPPGSNEPEWERRIRHAINQALNLGLNPAALATTLAYYADAIRKADARKAGSAS